MLDGAPPFYSFWRCRDSIGVLGMSVSVHQNSKAAPPPHKHAPMGQHTRACVCVRDSALLVQNDVLSIRSRRSLTPKCCLHPLWSPLTMPAPLLSSRTVTIVSNLPALTFHAVLLHSFRQPTKRYTSCAVTRPSLVEHLPTSMRDQELAAHIALVFEPRLLTCPPRRRTPSAAHHETGAPCSS